MENASARRIIMHRSPSIRFVLLFGLLCFPLTARSQSRQRPKEVPADYQITPFGYSHPSCITTVQEAERIDGHNVVGYDGSSRPIPPCNYDRFDGRGRRIPHDTP